MVSDQHLTRPWPEECDLLSRKLFGRSPLCQVFSVFRGKDKYICKIKTPCKTTIVISYRKPAPPPDLRYQRLTQLKGKKQTEIHFTRHPVWPDDCDLLSVGRKRCLSATMRLIWGDSDPPFKQGWPVNLVFPGCIQITTIPFSFKQQQFDFHSNNNNSVFIQTTTIGFIQRTHTYICGEVILNAEPPGASMAELLQKCSDRLSSESWPYGLVTFLLRRCLTFICIIPCNWSIRILRTSRNSISSENVPIVTIDCNL